MDFYGLKEATLTINSEYAVDIYVKFGMENIPNHYTFDIMFKNRTEVAINTRDFQEFSVGAMFLIELNTKDFLFVPSNCELTIELMNGIKHLPY